MKLSTKGRYGLRAMVDLAVYSEKESVSISCIAQRENISESYLEQLAGKLKKAGLIKSTRGAQGGYRLECFQVWRNLRPRFQSEIYCGLWKESLERWTVRD